MIRHLPPLNAAVALEATLRHRSVKKAADELHVTPAAVSQHLKHMETLYGVPLFLRHARGIAPTQAALQILPALSRALDHLDDAIAPLGLSGRIIQVNLSVLPSFASTWLLPRLADFKRSHPQIDLTLCSDRRLVDFDTEEVDLAIRYCQEPPAGLHAAKLFAEQVFPVCSPGLLYDAGALESLHDLKRLPLLHDADGLRQRSILGWDTWFERAGISPNIPTVPALHFNDSSLLIEAAVLGLGVALGREPLVQEHLRRGALVRPVPESCASERSYFIVCPKRNLRKAAIRTLVDWFLAQAAR